MREVKMSALDMVIRSGEVITSKGSLGITDIGIAEGKIAQIGGDLEARHVLDATGRLVFPGGLDPHVHLSYPGEKGEEPTWVDDFTSGSRAALAGGITTLGNMTFPEDGETPLASLNREMTIAREQSITDFFLHPVIFEPTDSALDDIRKLLENGCNSIKVFMVTPSFDSQVQEYIDAIRLAGEQGLITVIHCEDHALIEDATARLMAKGKFSLRYYAESRPVVSEVVATQRAVAITEATGSPMYVVHLSSKRALQVCVEAQSRDLPVYVETRPLYLHLTKERFLEEDGAKYVGQPPLREQEDVEALWEGLRTGGIHTVCTDHAPWSLAAKLDPSHTLLNLRPGVANLQTMLPMLYSEGVREGRISLARFVEVTSTNAAKLFGLYPQKGEIAVGSDADLVIFNPDLRLKITNDMLKSNSDYSAFEGWEVTGWPSVTLRRGEIVFTDNEVVGDPGSGKWVRRGASMPLSKKV
jgi:dihydropyrimidinase